MLLSLFKGFAVELFGTALFIVFIVSLKDKSAETQNIPLTAAPFAIGLVYAVVQMAAVSILAKYAEKLFSHFFLKSPLVKRYRINYF